MTALKRSQEDMRRDRKDLMPADGRLYPAKSLENLIGDIAEIARREIRQVFDEQERSKR